MANQGQKAGPGIAPRLSSPIQQIEENPDGRSVELPQARAVAIDPEIPVVAAQLLVQLLEEIAHPAVTVRPTPLRVPMQGRPQALARGPARQVGTPLAIPIPAKLEAKEVEGLRPIAGSRKRESPSLGRGPPEPELRHSLFELSQESIRLVRPLERTHDIVGVADQARLAPTALRNSPMEPQVQDVVQVDVGQHR